MLKDVLLALHVAGGAIGLLSFAFPLALRKGGRGHRRAGYLFVAGMTLAGATGLVVSIRFLLEGRFFAGVFFGLLSMLLFETTWSGVSAIRRKRSPEPSRRFIDRALPLALGAAGIGALLYGAMGARWLVVGFAILSIFTARTDYVFAARPLPTRMAWWYQHMSSMMASSIAAVTAFLVVNTTRLVGVLEPTVAWIPWVLPSLVIVPLFMLWIRRYKAKFRELA